MGQDVFLLGDAATGESLRDMLESQGLHLRRFADPDEMVRTGAETSPQMILLGPNVSPLVASSVLRQMAAQVERDAILVAVISKEEGAGPAGPLRLSILPAV